MLVRITFFLLIPFFAIGQKHHQRLSEIDVKHYRFQLELSDRSNLIYGKAKVDVQFKKAVSKIDLDLVAKDPKTGKGMEVTKVYSGKKELKFEQSENKLIIFLSQKAKVDTVVSFIINYRGIPTDGLIIAENKYGQRTFFGDNWPNRAHNWLPTVDHPSDKATVEFIVTAPDHYQVVANGEQVEETNVTDSTKITHWREKVPLPTKVMVIGVARFAVNLAGYVDTIPVTTWVYRTDRNIGFGDYKIAVDILDFFYQKIGSYPYEKLANVQSKTIYGGMENAGNIFYFENSVNGLQNQHKLVAHEIAHQWFGNSASELNWHHVWLSEGFATYMTDLYLEEVHGIEAFQENLKRERSQVLNYSRRNPTPVIDTTITNYVQLLSPNVYQKAGWVLHMLRQEIGTDIFWKGIRSYYNQYQFSNALTKDFQKVMEATSGKDLDYFFQQWLRQPGHPVLEVQHQLIPTGTKIIIRQKQAFVFDFPLELMLINKNGESIKKQIRINSKTHSFEIEENIQEIILDPNVKLLFEEG